MADDVSISVGLTGGNEVVAAVERLRKDFNETSVQFAKFMRQANDEAKSFQGQMERTGASASALGNIIANTVSGAFRMATGFIRNAISANVEWADTVKDMSEATGVSVKTVQELTAAARLEGEAVGKVEQAFTLLTQKVIAAREGSKSAIDIFKQLKLDPKQFKDAQDAVDKTFAALNKLPEGMERSEIAADLFGRRVGASMLRIIGATDEAKQAIKDFGLELTGEQVAALDQFKKTMNLAELASEALGRQITVQLAPALDFLLKAFLDVKKEGDGVAGMAKALGDAFTTTIGVGMKAVAMFVALGKSIAIVASALDGMNWTDFIVPIYGAIKAADRIKTAFKTFGPEVSAALEQAFGTANKFMEGDFPRAAATATNASAGFTRGIKEKEKAVKDLLAPLKQMRDRLEEQAATFGMNEVEAARWKVTHGELGKIAGAHAQAIRDEIIALTDRVAIMKRNKEAEEEIRRIQQKVREEEDKRELAQVEFVNKKKEEAQAFARSVNPMKDYLHKVEEIQVMVKQYGLEVEDAQVAQMKLAEALQKTIDAADPTKAMFDELIRAVEGFGKKFTENVTDFLVEGKLEVGNFAKEVHRLITNMLINTFVTKPIQDWATEMITILKGSSSQIEGFFGGKINSGFAQSAMGKGGGLFSGLLGGGGGGGFSGMIPEVAGMFAGGGTLPAGFSGIVGEAGPELITPTSRSRITPNDEMGGSFTVNNHFHVSGPLDPRSQTQAAARAGDSVRQAMRKNR